MKRYENGAALAKDMGITPAQLEQSFKDYNNVVKTKKCPFGKKFFQPGEWKMDDIFNVALMTPSSTTPWVVSRSTPSPVSSVLMASPSPDSSLLVRLLVASTEPTVSVVHRYSDVSSSDACLVTLLPPTSYNKRVPSPTRLLAGWVPLLVTWRPLRYV
jgi:hypothetical protein